MRTGRRAPVLAGVGARACAKPTNNTSPAKPSDLVRQLMRVCEEGGHMLNPFAGYGTTLVAADLEGSGWARIEMTGHYYGFASVRPTEGGGSG